MVWRYPESGKEEREGEGQEKSSWDASSTTMVRERFTDQL